MPRRSTPTGSSELHPDRYAWVPFGGGFRRCIGAAFAEMEMDVVLRTVLREFELSTTSEPDERWHARGVSFVPAKGGRAVLRRRRSSPRPDEGGHGSGKTTLDADRHDHDELDGD